MDVAITDDDIVFVAQSTVQPAENPKSGMFLDVNITDVLSV